MSAKLKLLERKLARGQTPEKVPAPTDDLSTAIQQLVDQRIAEALEKQPVKQSPKVQRLLNQFDAPAPATDYRELTPAKTPTRFDTVWHRDGAGNLLWGKTIPIPLIPGKPIAFIHELFRDGSGRIISDKTTPLFPGQTYVPGKGIQPPEPRG